MNSQWAIYGLFPEGAQKGRTLRPRALGKLWGRGGSRPRHLNPNQIATETKRTPSSGGPRAANAAAGPRSPGEESLFKTLFPSAATSIWP